MKEYSLYLESGPRRRTTMVHVLELLGCIAQGKTTEGALEGSPLAIRNFLRFIRLHGEDVQPDEAFTTAVAEHVTEGVWLGYGDPTPGFVPDFQPLPVEELEVYLQRLGGFRERILELVSGLSTDQLTVEPPVKGRPIYNIVAHIAESECAYLRKTVGKVEGLNPAFKRIVPDPKTLPDALIILWQVISSRLRTMSAEERSRSVPHGQVVWTARRGIRRTLEHEWEHLLEIANRLENQVC